MPALQKQVSKRARKPLYHAAKISNRLFLKVLWHFAKDDTTVEASRMTGLSVNAVNTIFQKLRRFFTEAGMFTDIYTGGDPANGSPLAEEEYEFHLIGFHFAGLKAKRGVGSGIGEDDHFAESHWRFHYAMLTEDRGGDAVDHMMYRHLLEVIRRCGPVGRSPINRRDGLRLCLMQMDERIRWAVRNAAKFKDDISRKSLRKISEL